MEVGDKVKFIGCSTEQHRWGSNTGNPEELKVGDEYVIAEVDPHSWSTKLVLEGIKGTFNNVCFEET
jgi:hypothetical protein